MSENEAKKIFARNLNYFLELNKLTQKDLVDYMRVSSSTVSDWCNANKMPRMDKIQSMANWFNIEKSDLLEDKSKLQEQNYYLNDETREIAQEIYDNKDLKILFDVARDTEPDTLRDYADFLKKLKDK